MSCMHFQKHVSGKEYSKFPIILIKWSVPLSIGCVPRRMNVSPDWFDNIIAFQLVKRPKEAKSRVINELNDAQCRNTQAQTKQTAT